MVTTGIYQIRNTINGKIYVGQSVNIKERIAQHKYKAFNKKDVGYNSAVHKALRKYGVSAFEFSVIEECSTEELDEREVYWIQKLGSISPSGYNILRGGQKVGRKTIKTCCVCGQPMHRSSKSMCLSCYNSSRTRNHDFNEIATSIVRGCSLETVAHNLGISSSALRKWLKRHNLPYHKNDIVSWCEKTLGLSSRSSTSKLSRRKCPLRCSVSQCDLSGRVITTFDSIRSAARFIGCRDPGIHRAIKTGRVFRGFYWKRT